MPDSSIVTPDDWELYEEDMQEISRFYYDDWINSIETNIPLDMYG